MHRSLSSLTLLTTVWVLDRFLLWGVRSSSNNAKRRLHGGLLDTLWSTCFCVFQTKLFAVSKIISLHCHQFVRSCEKNPGRWIWWGLQKTQNWQYSFKSLAGLTLWIGNVGSCSRKNGQSPVPFHGHTGSSTFPPHSAPASWIRHYSCFLKY